MNSEVIAVAIASALVASSLVWLVLRRQLRAADEEAQQQRHAYRALEAQLYEQQREAVAERNRLELEHQDRAKALRASAFEEGRQLGLAESQRERVNELTAQQASFAQRLTTERDEVAREVREKTRAEFEMQGKLFDVQVRPYLKVDKVEGYFRDAEVVEAGYQYQLLVNGIPAFQPSVVIEETRRGSRVNEEAINNLLQVAERTAKAAAELYLGAGASALKLGPAIIKRLAR